MVDIVKCVLIANENVTVVLRNLFPLCEIIMAGLNFD